MGHVRARRETVRYKLHGSRGFWPGHAARANLAEYSDAKVYCRLCVAVFLRVSTGSVFNTIQRI